MAKTNINPEVRFASFSENWVERELSKILTERKVMQKITEDAPLLAFAAGQGVIDRSERKSNNRDHLTHDQENKIYKLTELNDIVYNPSNLKYGAIDRNKHGHGVISPIYVTFTTEEEPSFVELLVKSERFKLRALQYEEGTVVKRQSVKPENLLSLKVNISPSKDEQKKIGRFNENLETLIKLHQNRYDNLVRVKKSMLDKMFPKQEQLVPEVRFKGFSEEWVNLNLGEEVLKIYSFKPYIAEPKIDGTYEVIQQGNNPIVGYSNGKPFLAFDKVVLFGDHTLSLFKPQNPFFVATDGIKILGNSIEISRDYFYALLERNKPVSQGYKRHLSILSELNISSSNNSEEQYLIGEYFKQIDNLINLYQNELKKLNNIKKACFEKMTNNKSKHFA